MKLSQDLLDWSSSKLVSTNGRKMIADDRSDQRFPIARGICYINRFWGPNWQICYRPIPVSFCAPAFRNGLHLFWSTPYTFLNLKLLHAVTAGSNHHYVSATKMEWSTSSIRGIRTSKSPPLRLGQDLGSGYVLSSRLVFLCSWHYGA